MSVYQLIFIECIDAMNVLKIEQTQNGNNEKIGQGSENVKHAISENEQIT